MAVLAGGDDDKAQREPAEQHQHGCDRGVGHPLRDGERLDEQGQQQPEADDADPEDGGERSSHQQARRTSKARKREASE